MTVTDEMVKAYRAKFRELWPGSMPSSTDAKVLLEAALAVQTKQTPTVKPIVWGTDGVSWWQEAERPRYEITRQLAGWRLDFNAKIIKASDDARCFDTVDAAKAAAYAHRQQRVWAEIESYDAKNGFCTTIKPLEWEGNFADIGFCKYEIWVFEECDKWNFNVSATPFMSTYSKDAINGGPFDNQEEARSRAEILAQKDYERRMEERIERR